MYQMHGPTGPSTLYIVLGSRFPYPMLSTLAGPLYENPKKSPSANSIRNEKDKKTTITH